MLVHEGWPCSRGSLLTDSGRRWVAAIRLHPGARAQVEAMLGVMATLAHQIDLIDCELRRLAKTDERLVALQGIFGIGPILACTILAEIGDAKRFRRARQVVRAAGLDPVVKDSADKQRRGQLAKQGAAVPALGAGRGRPARLPQDAAPITSSTAATAVTTARTRPRSPSRARSASAPFTSCASSRPTPPEHRATPSGCRPSDRRTSGRGGLRASAGGRTRSPR